MLELAWLWHKYAITRGYAAYLRQRGAGNDFRAKGGVLVGSVARGFNAHTHPLLVKYLGESDDGVPAYSFGDANPSPADLAVARVGAVSITLGYDYDKNVDDVDAPKAKSNPNQWIKLKPSGAATRAVQFYTSKGKIFKTLMNYEKFKKVSQQINATPDHAVKKDEKKK